MSIFFEKISIGETPSAEDWNDYLREAHALAPSMTPKAFAEPMNKEGLNSYQVLANSYRGSSGGNLLDLACGDGFFVQFLIPLIAALDSPLGKILGVDMSDGELNVARKNYNHPRVRFITAMAQELPLQSASIDHAFCHMAFMLMLPVDPVVKELGRVIKTGGKFSAVIGGEKIKAGLYIEISRITFDFLRIRYPKISEVKAGDPRVRSDAGLQEIFAKEFCDLEVEDFSLFYSISPVGVWDFMRDTYFVGMLPVPEQEKLKLELLKFALKNCDSAGKISFEFPMRKFTVTRI